VAASIHGLKRADRVRVWSMAQPRAGSRKRVSAWMTRYAAAQSGQAHAQEPRSDTAPDRRCNRRHAGKRRLGPAKAKIVESDRRLGGKGKEACDITPASIAPRDVSVQTMS